MKYTALALFAVAALLLPGCTTVEADSTPTTTSTTQESSTVRTPVGSASQTTTTRSY